ncbi:type I-D CRISPR-associated protein Cas10d/Csc3 [Nostoc sp. FACHB-87]|uniref:type I-D CRISPR-associated protein Cas10d/Csc3 n=1 Tax=Nostocaceae TaxID=1162 RepID=UPI00168628AC|nr:MULTISPECIES: type I-D CRISPR-associated protein Cas10d/Csc3 [Nostocaceae]MBD2458957.1 type I-D CRISPR-associated protein Cas10d/Csc3 [Nostoc sp. FACHB-87]MBD2479953.1 type I-D CRISPR-associated protein Cas10d/Csc3 [Anabaena sp. FACHB-83]
MHTLLQTLLIETLPSHTDPILQTFIQTTLPAMEREFGLITAMGGSQQTHYQTLTKQGDRFADENAKRYAAKPDQSLLVHVLNGLLTAWNLSTHLPKHLQLQDVEKRLLCLGLTLHDYNKYVRGKGEEQPPPKAHEVEEIINLCQRLGEILDFSLFWHEWREYLLEIAYLAQNTQFNVDSNPILSNWETGDRAFTIDVSRLNYILRHLLAFGDVAVHMGDPAEIVTTTKGDRLRDHLDLLSIRKKLVYHRLRDSRGLVTNQIHNAVVSFARRLAWEPILYFAQGAVYLAPTDLVTPDLADIQTAVWDSLIRGDEDKPGLAQYFQSGDVGFVRDGKGMKIAPQTLELFTPADLIRLLPSVVQIKVANVKSPATPKRLEKLQLTDAERTFLSQGADIRADRLAELIILAQREFFEGSQDYIPWMLSALGLQNQITPEQTQVQSGGVNYGWYQAAAHYIAAHATLDEQQLKDFLGGLSDRLATWAEQNHLLKETSSPTHEAFINYLAQYLEVYPSTHQPTQFENELDTYSLAKVNNQPICSLSAGDPDAEDQLDAVVLFKPQQYSNKNALGGGRIKRGISKIWSLEMLMRQAFWTGASGKLEEQQPVFLYIFPAYVYSPQVAVAVRRLVKELKRVNLWKVCKHWLDGGMQYSGLQTLPWRNEDEAEAGRYGDSYSYTDLPFMAMTYTTTRGKTTTDAWVEPSYLALALPILLGVKVVATSSPDPLYASDQEFVESAKLDGPAGFWHILGISQNLRLQDLSLALERLLIAYSIHLECRSSPPDARWQALNGTARDLVTDVLNVFAIANEGFRESKREPSQEDVKRIWKYAQIWIKGDVNMPEKLKLIERLVEEYRQFYQVNIGDSSHAVLLPLSKALEVILTVPEQIEREDIILQAAGQLNDAIERQEAYKRPFLMDKSVDVPTRKAQELAAIHKFMTTCVDDLFMGLYRGDRALLQENRNRIKSGAEFAYRWLALQEKQTQKTQSQG